MKRLMGDQDNLKKNLYAYVQAFSPSVRDIFERFDFPTHIERLAKANLLYLVAVERPQRDEAGNVVLSTRGRQKGQPQPDSSLRDTENVPLTEDVQAYFKREVLPHAPDAWIDPDKTKVGYEIPFNRHFYVFEPPRPLEEIDADLAACTDRIKAMIEGLTA